jgi:hypothetical protein
MNTLYHLGESSVDERHWTISSPKKLTREELNNAFAQADLNVGQKPQKILLDTGKEVVVVFEGVEFGDDAKVLLYHGDVREEQT